MSPRVMSWFALFVLLVACSTVRLPGAQAAEQTIQGEVIDPATYLKDGRHGSQQVEQTYESVDGGQTLAILDEQNKALYILLADNPGTDPSELAYDYVNQKVKVVGQVYERDGLRGIVASSIEPIESSANPAASSKTTSVN